MVKIRLRTKFLLSLIFTTAALTGASLLIVQKYLGKYARHEIYEQLNSSLLTFQQFAQQRQRVLAQSAEIAANLPNIKALMTTQDERTIQDASADFLQMAVSDLFLLANGAGKVMALHTQTGAFDRQIASRKNPDWLVEQPPDRAQPGHLLVVQASLLRAGQPALQAAEQAAFEKQHHGQHDRVGIAGTATAS